MFIINLIDNSIENFESIVEEVLDSDEPDKMLINSFFILRERFKKLKGTASGFSGIAEFLLFRYAKRYLEKEMDIEFKNNNDDNKKDEVNKNKLYPYEAKFKNNKIVMTSDIQIGKYLNTTIKNKPDIYIKIQNQDGAQIPIAFFEIKVFIHATTIENQIVNKYNKLKEKFKENLPLFVVILFHTDHNSDEYKKQLKSLKEQNYLFLSFVKGSWESEDFLDGKIDGQPLNEILKKVIKKINDTINNNNI